MAFKPKTGDTPAPRGYRRYIDKSEGELGAAYALIRRDLAHCSVEQVLNVIVELHRRSSRNKLFALLTYLGELNAEQYAPEPENRIS